MTVKLKKENGEVVTPFKAHETDYCCDVFAASEKEVAPNVWMYGTGLHLQMVKDMFRINISKNVKCIEGKLISQNSEGFMLMLDNIPMSIDFRARSSVWKTGMVLSNSVGTIDEGYTGEISAVFYHVMPDMPRYKVGDKIGQIKIGLSLPMNFREVEELDETDRGSHGYGSTGK